MLALVWHTDCKCLTIFLTSCCHFLCSNLHWLANGSLTSWIHSEIHPDVALLAQVWLACRMKGPCSLSAFIGSEQSMAWWILTISCMLVHFQQSSVNPYTPHIVTQTCIRKTEEVLHPVRIQRFVVDVHVLIWSTVISEYINAGV